MRAPKELFRCEPQSASEALRWLRRLRTCGWEEVLQLLSQVLRASKWWELG